MAIAINQVMGRVPILSILLDTVLLIVRSRKLYGVLSGLWLVLFLPFKLATDYLIDRQIAINPDAPLWDVSSVASWAIVVEWIVARFVFGAIAVNWHRFFMLGEWPNGKNLLRRGSVIWHYFWISSAVGSAGYLAYLFLFNLLASVLFSIWQIAEMGLLAHVLAASIVMPFSYRFLAGLPGISLGQAPSSVFDTFAKSKGFTMQLCIGGIVIIAATLGLDWAMRWVSGDSPHLLKVLQEAVQWLIITFDMTYLMLLYVRFQAIDLPNEKSGSALS